jgi:hypothetical protein
MRCLRHLHRDHPLALRRRRRRHRHRLLFASRRVLQ